MKPVILFVKYKNNIISISALGYKKLIQKFIKHLNKNYAKTRSL